MPNLKTDSFIRDLCLGVIREDILFPFPKIKDEEKALLRSTFDSFQDWLGSKADDFRKWDEAGEMPETFLQEMKQFGLFGFVAPENQGGFGFSTSAYSRTIQELATYDGSVAVTAGAHSSIGYRGLLLFGTQAQKDKYIPKLATGEMIAAFCLTEPGAGSDAASIKTKAVKDGKDWILNGEKLWITNGGIADFFTVFARTDGTQGQITAFIVTRDMAGVRSGPHENKMGIRASSTTSIYLENVRVPEENVMGEVGKGFKVAMKILNSGRTGLGGGSVGGMKRVIEFATKQAKNRQQFKTPISQFGLVKQKIGHMVVDCYATESAVSLVSGLIDQGYEDYAIEAAISKVFASEALWRTLDEGLQIAGGNGYMREFPYERALRDARINRIFEGTNEILRLFIGLTEMNDVGSHLKEVASSIGNVFHDPIKGFGVLTDYARRRVAQATGVGKSELTLAAPELKAGKEVFEVGTQKLSAAVEKTLKKYRKDIIGKQLITRRLADTMIDLFVLAATLSRVTQAIQEKGADKCQQEIQIVEIFSGQVERRIRDNLARVDENDDATLEKLADHAVELEKFAWDTI